jgi:hypothetical protein
MKIRLFVLLILLNACNNNAVENKKEIRPDSARVVRDSTVVAPVQNKVSRDTARKKVEYVLFAKNDSMEQHMWLAEVSKHRMNFRLITVDTRSGLSDTIRGKLVYVSSSGDENDVGDDLKAFFYDDWDYTDKKTSCFINFRISVDDCEYVRIQDVNCSVELKRRTPIDMKEVLKRVDIR